MYLAKKLQNKWQNDHTLLHLLKTTDKKFKTRSYYFTISCRLVLK